MGIVARFMARRRILRAQKTAHKQARQERWADLRSQIQAMVANFATPEERDYNERTEAANQAALNLNQQTADFRHYTLEYKDRYFPNQSLPEVAFRGKKMTPERLHDVEHEWLPRAVEWERLSTILREHAADLEKDYPLGNFSNLRTGGFKNQKLARAEVKILTKLVKQGKKEIEKEKAKAGGQRSRGCEVM